MQFWLKGAAALMIASTLFAFTGNFGGEHYEVFIGSERVVSQFVSSKGYETPKVALPAQSDGQLTVKYNHCGRNGEQRSLSLTDSHNKVLKTWSYKETTAKQIEPLAIDLKALASYAKASPVNLVYTSKELPDGRVLATLTRSTNTARAE